MSRSYKKTPIRTILDKMSQHRGKKAASRRFRRVAKVQLQEGKKVFYSRNLQIRKEYCIKKESREVLLLFWCYQYC